MLLSPTPSGAGVEGVGGWVCGAGVAGAGAVVAGAGAGCAVSCANAGMAIAAAATAASRPLFRIGRLGDLGLNSARRNDVRLRGEEPQQAHDNQDQQEKDNYGSRHRTHRQLKRKRDRFCRPALALYSPSSWES